LVNKSRKEELYIVCTCAQVLVRLQASFTRL
jgi:hypothetical protein